MELKTFKNFILNEAKIRVIQAPFKHDNDPKFKAYYVKDANEFLDWYNTLGLDDAVDGDIILEPTGEILLLKGETRRNKLKKKGTKDYNEFGDKSFETIKANAKEKLQAPMLDPKSSLFERDFLEFYNIKEENYDKLIDKETKDRLVSGDYDIFFSFPAEIERKDKRPFKKNDIWNIQMYLKKFNDKLPFKIKLNKGIVPKEGMKLFKLSTDDFMFN